MENADDLAKILRFPAGKAEEIKLPGVLTLGSGSPLGFCDCVKSPSTSGFPYHKDLCKK